VETGVNREREKRGGEREKERERARKRERRREGREGNRRGRGGYHSKPGEREGGQQ
jgi:hypothetical protein